MNLFQVNKEIEALIVRSIDSETGEVLNENFSDDLEALQLNRKEQQKNTILYYKNVQNEESIINAEIARLNDLKKIVQRKQDVLRELVIKSLEAEGVDGADFITCGAKFKKNPPALIIDDESGLTEYAKTEIIVKIDKNAIKKDLKEGKEIKGVRLEAGTRLEIY